MSGKRNRRHQTNFPQKESARHQTTVDQMAQTGRLTDRQADRQRDK